MNTVAPTSKTQWLALAIVATGSCAIGRFQVDRKQLVANLNAEGARVLATTQTLESLDQSDGPPTLDSFPVEFWRSNHWEGHAWDYKPGHRLEIGEYTVSGGFMIWYTFKDEQWHYNS